MVRRFNRFLESELIIDDLKKALDKAQIDYSDVTRKEDFVALIIKNLAKKKTAEIFADSFADSLINGKNNIKLISKIDRRNHQKTFNYKNILDNLKRNDMEEYCNKLFASHTRNKLNMDYLIYHKLMVNNGIVDKITILYLTKRRHQFLDENGVPAVRDDYEITGVTIDSINKEIIVHTKSRNVNKLNEAGSFKGIYNNYSDKVTRLHNIKTVQMKDFGKVMYKIFEKMTNEAAAPYKKRIMTCEEMINDSIRTVCQSIQYDLNRDFIELRERIFELFERALINQNPASYLEYRNGREGIVQNISFSDLGGARVSASVGESDTDISNYDIYFDTKKTLESTAYLYKMYVKWFVDQKGRSKEVKLFTYDRFCVVHFLYGSARKEDVEYVLQKIRDY